jgi:hypothetical protein
MSKLPKSHFWEWFKRNNKEYLELKKKTKKEASYWMNELTAHLRVCFRYFGFSITLPDNGVAKLTVTVNGRAMYFEKVEAFVAKAPEIPGWTVISLEEPMPVDFMLEKPIEKAGIHPSEFSFSFASDEPADTDIIIYHPLCTEDNNRQFLLLAYDAMYNLLGERSYGADLGRAEMANLSAAGENEIYQFEELPTHISLRRPAMVIDHNGTLLSKQ